MASAKPSYILSLGPCFIRTQYETFVALESVYFRALEDAGDVALSLGGPWVEALLVGSAPWTTDYPEDPPFDCRLSYLLVATPAEGADDSISSESSTSGATGGEAAHNVFPEGDDSFPEEDL